MADDLKQLKSENEGTSVPSGYFSVIELADKFGYSKDYVSWLARSGKIEAFQKGNKNQWFASASSLKRYQLAVKLIDVGKGYLSLKLLSKKYGYAKDYLGWLARTGKVEAVMASNSQWFIREQSLERYRLQVVLAKEKKSALQNKVFPIVSPIPSERHNRGSSISKPNQNLEEIGTKPVLLNESSSNADEVVAEKEELTTRINTVFKATMLLGGILIFTFFAPGTLIDDTHKTTGEAKASIASSFVRAFASASDSLRNKIINFLGIDMELRYRVITIVNEQKPSPPPSVITKEITFTKNINPLELEALKNDLSQANLRISSLYSDFSSFQKITPPTFQLPSTNTKGIGPITLNPAHLVSETLTVSGASTLSSTLSVLSDFSVDTSVFKVDTTNNRVGINTSSPEVAFELIGVASVSSNLLVTGNIGIGTTSVPNQLTVIGSGSFTGQLKATRAPVVAHTGTWPSFTNTADSTLYINPSSPIADGNVIAYVSGSDPKFVVDAEGDIYGNNLILTGSTTTATQTVGDLLVEGSTQLGDAVGDKIKFVGTIVPKTLTSFPLLLKASTSQTVDVFRIKDPNDNVLLTVDEGTGLLTASSGFNFALGNSTATVSYSRLGTAVTGHSNYISRYDDLLISGDLETRGTASFGGVASVSGNFFTYGTNIFSGTGSSSFAGSLSVTKGFLAGANNAFRVNANATADTLNIVGGNVGIGTTIPTSLLTVQGRGEFQGTASASYLMTGNTLQVGGFASAAYSRFGISTTGHSNYISGSDDLLISGDLEVKGSISANIASASRMFISNPTASASLSFRGNGSGGVNQSLFSIGVGNGTERLDIFNNDNSPFVTIASSGNVGIGTTAPSQKLDIEGSGNQEIHINATGVGDNAVIRTINGDRTWLAGTRGDISDSYVISDITAGENRLTITSTGNVGIGTTVPGSLTHLFISDVTGVTSNASTTLTLEKSGNGNYIEFIGSTTSNEHGLLWSDATGNPGAVRYNFSGDQMQFAASGSFNFQTGNVGIGTTGPGAKLQLTDGDFYLSDADVAHGMTTYVPTTVYSRTKVLNDTDGGLYLSGLSDTGTVSGLYLEGVIGSATPDSTTAIVKFSALKKDGTTIQAAGSSDIAFQFLSNTGASPKYMTILGNGNVGIGTTGPLDVLHVVGDIRTSACASDGAGDVACVDVAETFPASDDLEAGDLVGIDQGFQITASSGFAIRKSGSGAQLIGIVSTSPAILIEGNQARFGGPKVAGVYAPGDKAPVALAGRVPVKVSLENGPIEPGDRLTLSSTPGVAMKMTEAGQSIGIALEALVGTNGKVLVFVNLGYWAPSVASVESNSEMIMGNTVNNNLIFNAVITMFKDAFNIVFEQGLLKVANIITDKITAKELCIEEVCVNKAQLQALLQNANLTPTLSATPTPEPESTPEPNSTSSPQATPETTAEPTPEPTPEITPDLTPTPESIPETTPTPEPTSESTPEPEPIPEVSPQPEPSP